MEDNLTEHQKIFLEIVDGIDAYIKEHEHRQVCDPCKGIYIPSNVVKRLIEVRLPRLADDNNNPVPNSKELILLAENPVLNCRKVVKDFACIMEQKLKKNDYKKHWNNCNQEYLLNRLDQEVKELRDCFFIYSPGDMNFLLEGRHEDKIPGEAADVANFAMMLWDNFGHKEKSSLYKPTQEPSHGP